MITSHYNADTIIYNNHVCIYVIYIYTHCILYAIFIYIYHIIYIDMILVWKMSLSTSSTPSLSHNKGPSLVAVLWSRCRPRHQLMMVTKPDFDATLVQAVDGNVWFVRDVMKVLLLGPLPFAGSVHFNPVQFAALMSLNLQQSPVCPKPPMASHL